jgi:hypothetical protein
MEWKKISKTAAPATGTYRDWKSVLAIEASYQCVYCCIHESKFGGQRNFHVEHFRPKSIFPLLENSYGNLFYACGICNSFKGNDWPNEPVANDFSKIAYPDPSTVCYGELFEIKKDTGIVYSKFLAGNYIVERLYLNRPQMITLRRLTHYIEELTIAKKSLQTLYEAGNIPADKVPAVMSFLFKLTKLHETKSEARPYEDSQVKRPK